MNELQDFFNTYYVPNNAILVIAGDFETDAASKLVKKYYGWIPKGAPIERPIPKEPEQTETRKAVTPQRVPLAAIMIGYKTAEFKSDDNYALNLLGTILGEGRSSRLDRLLVNSENPLCVSAEVRRDDARRRRHLRDRRQGDAGEEPGRRPQGACSPPSSRNPGKGRHRRRN